MKLINKTYIFYTLFTILVTIVFLYAKFPGDSVSRYTEFKVNQNSNINVSIGGSTPLLPPGIQYTDICIKYSNKKITCIPDLRVYPLLYPLFGDISFEGSIFGGIFESNVSDSGKTIYTDLQRIRLDQIDLNNYMKNSFDIKFSGLLDSIIDITKTKNNIKGKVTVNIDNCQINLKKFPVKKVNFKKLRSSFLLNHKVITIKDIEFDGPELSGNINGTIFIDKVVMMSKLNLTCQIKPSIGFIESIKKKLPLKMLMGNQNEILFKVKGTIKKPLWRLK